MRALFVVLLLSLFAHADAKLPLIKGQALFLELEKKGLIALKAEGKPLNFFPHPKDENKVLAIFSLPYKNPPKSSKITAFYADKTSENFLIQGLDGNYSREKITIPAQKIFPPKAAQKRIQKERAEAKAIYAHHTPKALFEGAFQLPLKSPITSAFGVARIFNEKVASFHSGTDFRAHVGTAIRAVNSGIVKIAKERYYAGLSVVIDHGFGIYSQYYHLSSLKVEAGQRVKKGQIIGASGASGRVSGPHLHFGIFAGGRQVDPLDFITKFNALFQ